MSDDDDLEGHPRDFADHHPLPDADNSDHPGDEVVDVNTDDESLDDEPAADEDFSLYEEDDLDDDAGDLFVIDDDNLDD